MGPWVSAVSSALGISIKMPSARTSLGDIQRPPTFELAYKTISYSRNTVYTAQKNNNQPMFKCQLSYRPGPQIYKKSVCPNSLEDLLATNTCPAPHLKVFERTACGTCIMSICGGSYPPKMGSDIWIMIINSKPNLKLANS